uniref:Chromodomain-helicase-DNA-binding protein 1-like n=1 Tax=Macrostomum lignano TaxID=282301 RepID=A0A1I8HTB7_9PLAT
PNINVAMDAVKSAIARIPEAPEPLGRRAAPFATTRCSAPTGLAPKFSSGHGAILADEMGLGKTLQTVAFLLGLHGGRRRGGVSGRSLIVCPLSVLNNWRDELAKFAPQLTVRVYTGDKAERERLRAELRREDWTLLLSTYELCLKDEEFFAKFSFDAMVVDEGHRLKNSNSQLHLALRALNVSCRFILTGTPIQNNLDELFTLLSFVAPKVFRLKLKDQFIAEVTDLVSSNDNSGALYEILKPFLLRRIKEDVLKSLPKKVEVILYHGLTALQKKYYKAILTKNIDAFDTATGNKTRLLNIQMQLRKCINHPYLFDGVEPEPFQPGEHLVTASAKLILIDRLLKYLKANGHKVLMFSQMTHMLDILQDYLTYRGFTYERLDGSVRGEERFLAVKNFNQTAETFVFLLSTRAGGVGLNLVSADTVIFVDSDFNPQNDLQAAARVHRIGQTRNVKIIRLAGKNTIEEIILRRAETKLALTKQVIGHGKFALGFDDADKAKEADASKQLMDDIEDADAVGSVDFGAVLGPTEQPGGRWVWSEPPEPPAAGKSVSASNAAASATSAAAAEEEAAARAHGKDYSSGAADIDQLEAKDETALQALLTDLRVKETAEAGAGRGLRGQQASGALTQLPDAASSRRQARRPLTEAEKAERRAKREAAAAARAAEAEAAARRREERRAAEWRAAGYTSHSVAMATDSSDEEAADDEPRGVGDIGEDNGLGLNYVIGDVAEPQEGLEAGAAIVCQSVDDAGRWGSGGVFAALDAAWPKSGVGAAYEAASRLGDLRLGDLHLLPLGKRHGAEIYCGLLVCQDSSQPGRPIQLRALQQCLEKLRLSARRLPRRIAASSAARDAVASVHLPRLGHGLSAGLGWYGVERNLQKLLARRGVPAFVYYFPRKRRQQRRPEINDESAEEPEAEEAAAAPEPKRPRLALADIFTGCRVGLAADLPEADADQLARYLLAYDADVQLTVPAGAAAAAPQGQLDFL